MADGCNTSTQEVETRGFGAQNSMGYIARLCPPVPQKIEWASQPGHQLLPLLEIPSSPGLNRPKVPCLGHETLGGHDLRVQRAGSQFPICCDGLWGL